VTVERRDGHVAVLAVDGRRRRTRGPSLAEIGLGAKEV
jgi:hypothetical protein